MPYAAPPQLSGRYLGMGGQSDTTPDGARQQGRMPLAQTGDDKKLSCAESTMAPGWTDLCVKIASGECGRPTQCSALNFKRPPP